jgi:hypothetical protein
VAHCAYRTAVRVVEQTLATPRIITLEGPPAGNPGGLAKIFCEIVISTLAPSEDDLFNQRIEESQLLVTRREWFVAHGCRAKQQASYHS